MCLLVSTDAEAARAGTDIHRQTHKTTTVTLVHALGLAIDICFESDAPINYIVELHESQHVSSVSFNSQEMISAFHPQITVEIAYR